MSTPAPRRNASKPRQAPKSPASAKKGSPDSFLEWLGRQVAHVKVAVKTDVTAPAKPARPAPAPALGKASSAKPAAAAARKPAKPVKPPEPAAEPSLVVYRKDKIEEAELPDRPGVKLRRTIIDEVIVNRGEQQ